MAQQTAVRIMLLLAAGAVTCAEANAFRGSGPAASHMAVSVREIRAALMSELMSALGADSKVESRLGGIEEALRPMVATLPKNHHGRLDKSAVRYVLHRFFVQRHGMFLKGLEPAGDAWASATSGSILEDEVPAYVLGLLEQRLGGDGLGLHEVAVLAATLDHLVLDEAKDRLRAAYGALDLSTDARLGTSQADEVFDTYMLIFINGRNHSQVTKEELKEDRAVVHEIYPNWEATRTFVKGIRSEVLGAAGGDVNFDDVTRVLDEVGHRYGRWQDHECRDLKKTLVGMGDSSTGRVLLKDFYSGNLGGSWQFGESPEYLRSLGALDESVPNRPSVIIPNYVNSPTNCVASSSLYEVCCIDECEGIMGQVEREIASPEAEPSRILDVVARIPSESTVAPRELDASLKTRLDDVAATHGGTVPLHGRLFAQWMHHAYPQECPYPHLTGETRPQTADEWMASSGKQPTMSEAEMRKHVEESAAAHAAEKEPTVATVPWIHHEELFHGRDAAVKTAGEQRASWADWLRNLMLLLLLGSAALSARSTLKSALGSVRGGKKPLELSL